MGKNTNYYLFICFLLPLVSLAQDNCNTEKIAESIKIADSLRLDVLDYPAAIALLKNKVNECKSTLNQNSPTDLATLYHKIAVNLFYQAAFAEALEYIDQSLNIRESLGESVVLDLSNSVYLKAIILRFMGNFGAAKDNYEKAIQLLEDSPTLSATQKAEALAPKYEEMGILSISLGDYLLALSYLEKAEIAYVNYLGTRNDGTVAYIISKKANVYHSLKDFTNAIATYDIAIGICNGFDPSNNPDVAEFLGTIYNDKALAYAAIENYNQAEITYNNALDLYRPIGLSKLLSNTYSNLILVYAHQNNFSAAENAYQQGLQLAQEVFKTNFHHSIAELHRNMGEAESLRNKHDIALGHFKNAVTALVPSFESNNTYVNPNVNEQVIGPKMELLQILSRKTQTLQANSINNPSDNAALLAAFETYQTLDTLITKIRQSYQAQGSKFYLTETVVPIYERAIAVALDLFNKTQDPSYRQAAYTFVARNKAIVLLDGFQEEQARTYADIPAEVLTEEQNIKQEMSVLEQAIYEAQQNEEESNVDSLRLVLFDWKRKKDRFIKHLEGQYPQYYDFKYAFGDPVLLENLQSQLEDSTALLEYFAGEQKIYTFLLTSSDIKIFEQDMNSDFIPTLQKFRRSISDWTYVQANPTEAESEFIQAAQQLYDWLNGLVWKDKTYQN